MLILYISRVGGKKKKFSTQTYCQKSENVPNLSLVQMTSQWVLNKPAPRQHYLLSCQSRELSLACWRTMDLCKELKYSPNWWLPLWEGEISQPYWKVCGKKVIFIYLYKIWKYYIFPFLEKNASRKNDVGTSELTT